jgi:phosphatidylserine/phosphatidylglycerophosphate/cardiolipin synthase-like enzyme
MQFRRSLAAALLSVGVAATTLLVPSAPADAAGYTPHTGAVFNNPLDAGPVKYRVLNVVQDAIDHAPSGSLIRIMSWNIMSRSVVYKLLRAQRRGVRILALMDDSNRTELPNPDYARLHRGLIQQNRSAGKDRHSHARTCINSCRGSRGQAHGKFFLFSKTGHKKHVLMEGSTNLTAAAALNQWNDVFTFVGNDRLYNFGSNIFQEMWRDKPVRNPYREKLAGTVQMMFSPMRGQNYHGDRRLQLLNRVRCFGVRNAGIAGRTVIRVTPDVIRNRRGMQFARRLRYLWASGCDIKLGYTVMGQDIHRFLRQGTRRGPIPMKHLVQDYNGDGEFDNYFHLKAMSIDGHVGADPSAHFVVNGSSNISGFAAASDENIAIIRRKAATLHYEGYINYWFDNFPQSVPPTTTARRTPGFDPYAHVDMD